MKRIYSIFIGCIVIAATIALGTIHGSWTNRWGNNPDLLQAGRKLEQLPKVLGNWRLKQSNELERSVSEMLQCSGNVSRVYENTNTGEIVQVFLVVGPSGPIAVHTPEVCYSTKDYSLVAPRQRWSPNETDEFWDLRMVRNDLTKSQLRVLYGWTNNTHWQAVEQPRFWFGGRPVLYKLQFAGPVPVSDDHDPASDFLSELLPILRDHMIDAS